INRLSENGSITDAAAGLADMIGGLLEGIMPLIEMAITLGAELGPSIGDLLASMAGPIQEMIPMMINLGQVVIKILKPVLPAVLEIANAFGILLTGALEA